MGPRLLPAALAGPALVIGLASCSGPTPRKAADARDRAASTATSAAMVAAAWDSGAAPGIYASHATAEMSASLGKADSAPVWSALPDSTSAAIHASLRVLGTTAAKLDSAIDREDRPGATRLRTSLERHGQELSAIPIDTAS
jgi:hypothetical protein